MAFHRGPDIRTKNLVCCQDPHNHKNDYNGTGVTKDVSGVRDSSGAIQYGALTNGAAYTTNSHKTYSFDGSNDYHYLGVYPVGFRKTAADWFGTGYTVIQWILPTDTGYAGGQSGTFCNDGATITGNYVGFQCFYNGSGYWGMMMGDNSGTSPSDRRTRLSYTKAQIDQWQHVAFWTGTDDHSKWEIYVNGVATSMQGETGSGGSVVYSGSATAAIGVNRTNYFKGEIGGTWVYDAGLESNEIMDHYLKTQHKYIDPV